MINVRTAPGGGFIIEKRYATGCDYFRFAGRNWSRATGNGPFVGITSREVPAEIKRALGAVLLANRKN